MTYLFHFTLTDRPLSWIPTHPSLLCKFCLCSPSLTCVRLFPDASSWASLASLSFTVHSSGFKLSFMWVLVLSHSSGGGHPSLKPAFIAHLAMASIIIAPPACCWLISRCCLACSSLPVFLQYLIAFHPTPPLLHAITSQSASRLSTSSLEIILSWSFVFLSVLCLHIFSTHRPSGSPHVNSVITF